MSKALFLCCQNGTFLQTRNALHSLWNYGTPLLPPEKEPRLVRISWAFILLGFPSCEQMERVGFSLCIHGLLKAVIKTDFGDFCSVQLAVIQHTLKSETTSPEFSQ